MELINNELVVYREYEWKLKRMEIVDGKYCLSEVFNVII
jgi:hypothetical protein